jgi:hypothetical protein
MLSPYNEISAIFIFLIATSNYINRKPIFKQVHKLTRSSAKNSLLRGMGIFLFTTASRTALGPTQPIEWVVGTLSRG